MKKILSLIVALVVLSVPISAASHLDVDVDVDVSTRSGGKAEKNDAAVQSDTTLGVRTRGIIGTDVKIKDRLEIRAERLAEVDTAVEKTAVLKSDFADVKARLTARKEALEDCRGDASQECQEERTEAKKDAIDGLFLLASRVEVHLESVKEKLADRNIDAAQKSQVTAEIDASLARVEEIRAEISSMTETATAAEVKAKARELRSIWADAAHDARVAFGLYNRARIHGVTTKAEQLTTKLDTRIDALEARGQDVAELRADLAAYQAKVAEAKAQLALAAQLHAEAVKSDAKRTELQASQEALVKARTSLHQAQDELQDIMVGLRAETQVEGEATVE